MVSYLRRHHVGLLAVSVALSGTAYTRLDAGDAISVLAEQQSGGDLDVTLREAHDAVGGPEALASERWRTPR
jgi:hypothetical protein